MVALTSVGEAEGLVNLVGGVQKLKALLQRGRLLLQGSV